MGDAAVPTTDDLLAPDVIADPHPLYEAMRAHDGLFWSETHKAWLLARYEDAVAALIDYRTFSSDRVKPLLASLTPAQHQSRGAVMEMIQDWMVVTDPPAHTRLRRLAASAFNPKRVATYEQRIRELVDELLDRFIEDGHEDLIEHFTFQLPAIVIAEIIGAPAEDRDLFHEWSEALALVAFGAGGEDRGDRHERAMRGLQEMLDYVEGLIERSRREPGEDMISGLLEGDGRGNVLTDDELKSMCALMLFAGHETTTTLVSNGVKTMLEHPERLEMLRRDPELAPQAVEEILRYEGPIKVLIRWITQDTEFRGQRLEAGQRAFVLLGAANRDGERFDRPMEFDITRKPNPHVAFGKGVHACIGAQLARIEARLAFSDIFRKLPGLRITGDPLEWTPSLASRSLRRLPVAHDARR